MLRHPEIQTRMPSRYPLCGQRRPVRFKERDRHAGRQMPDGMSRCGMNKSDQIAPDKAVPDRSQRTLPNGRPDAAQQGL